MLPSRESGFLVMFTGLKSHENNNEALLSFLPFEAKLALDLRLASPGSLKTSLILDFRPLLPLFLCPSPVLPQPSSPDDMLGPSKDDRALPSAG